MHEAPHSFSSSVLGKMAFMSILFTSLFSFPTGSSLGRLKAIVRFTSVGNQSITDAEEEKEAVAAQDIVEH